MTGGSPFRRRTVLKTIGASVVGGAVLTGPATAKRENLASTVASKGYYSHFPLGPLTWKRSKNPFDTTTDDGERWKAQPATRGSIRCLVKDITFFGNAGFEVPVGPVGDINSVSIDAETIETERDGGNAWLAVALYLDVDDDGEFFAWKDARGNNQLFTGFGGDGESIMFPAADGEFTIDENTHFPFVGHLPGNGNGDTWGDIVTEQGEDTNAALYVGVAGNEAGDAGTGAGQEEIIVHSMEVERE